MRRFIPLLLGLIGLTSFFVAQSGAAGTKPAPSCAGVAATDPNGDSVSDPIGLGAGSKGPDNLEITRIWFDRTGGKTTANIEVKKLSKAIISSGPNKPSSISWYFVWTTDADHFVSASSDGNAVTYGYGDLAANNYSTTGDTTGQFFEGDQGVISIVIPADIGGATGSKLDAPYATATEDINVVAGSLLSTDDRAPDTDGGKAWTVVDCPGGGTTGPSGPTGPEATATPTPGPGGGGEVVQPGALNVKASTALGKAKKAKKGKTVKVGLSGEATNIDATLYKGTFAKPKVYGKGKLATLKGKAKLKLKISKKVKKGSYALTLIGTNPDGARAEKSFKVKFKK
jgi:hypothetical protein